MKEAHKHSTRLEIAVLARVRRYQSALLPLMGTSLSAFPVGPAVTANSGRVECQLIAAKKGMRAIFCHHCGANIGEDADFCHICGTKVAHEEQQPQASGATGKEPPVGEPSATDPPRETPGSQEPSKFKVWWDSANGFMKVLAALGILVAAGIIIWLVVSFLREFGYLLLGVLVAVAIIITLLTGTKEDKAEVRQFVLKGVIGLVFVVVIAVFVVMNPNLFMNFVQPGYAVRGAYLSQYSEDVTVEDAFNSYFDNPQWSTYEEGGYSYVAFTGGCEYMGEKVDIRLTFQITGEQFRIERLDVNGIEQSDFILYALLESVYDAY